MRVKLEHGETIGEVTATYELPQGLTLDVASGRGRQRAGSVSPRGHCADVDTEARVIVVAPEVAVRLMLRINVVTIFPEFFAGPLALSIPARAKSAGGVEYSIVDLRDFTHDKHRTVDDAPYGGGPGMVMKPGPFFEAVEALGATAPIVLLSPRGRLFTQADAVRIRRARADAAVRPLQGRGSAGRRSISPPKKSRSGISC